MKFKKILMLDFKESTFESQYWERIDALCEEKVLLDKDSGEIESHLADSDCVLVNFLPTVDKQRIDAMQNLKYIGILATGYGRIDDAYAATKSIPVCNIPGYSREGVAEFTFGAILEAIRELERAKRQAREGDYSEDSFTGTELKDKKFGVIGLGANGSRVAEIALGFNSAVTYWSKNRKDDYESKGVAYTDLDTLMKESDFISLNLARNKETEAVINAERINAIKPDAIVINTSPMELMDMEALDARLGKGDITFILDHSDELSKEWLERFAKHKNCVLYPPIAYTTKEATKNKQEIFVSNLENFIKGTPQNKVN